MAKKLSEDYIKFTLSLSTSEAQQEIRRLEKATQGLKELSFILLSFVFLIICIIFATRKEK